jgi:hypothetical protein
VYGFAHPPDFPTNIFFSLGCRFVASEKWRKEFGTDDLPRTFDYAEKPEVSQYYVQFYHKTDNVCLQLPYIVPVVGNGFS